ncbi:hypothetical protein [Sulfitobacter sp. HGT1]|jgi:hypothetical protein|uniref:hypothetical protein n=1 Tax=unclassified Sulfitobacter TaxID=196795 RepID=UPI0015940320|nr:hypothetical protein [Sulfitobacter sp. HGT1]
MTSSLNLSLLSCLVSCIFILENADESQIDDDFSVKLMENLSSELQALEPNVVSEIVDLISQLANEESDAIRKEFLENFADFFGLEAGPE